MGKISTSALGVMFLTIIGYIVGFLVQVAIAHTLGIGANLDAFVVASVIPEFIFGITNAIFLTAFIVIFPEYLKKERDAAPLISTLFTMLSIFLGLCMLFIIFFAEVLAKKIAPGFTEIQLELIVLLIRLLSVSVFFFGISSFMTGILNHEHHFLVPKATRSIIGLGVLIAILSATKVTALTLVFGTIAGIIAVDGIEYYILKKKGYSFSFSINPHVYDSIKEILKMSSPLIFSSLLYYATKTAMNMFATTQGEGSVSILNYAFLVSTLPIIFFSGSISSIIFPYLTKKYVYNKGEEGNVLFVKSFSILWIVLIPISILFIILSSEIIHILFERGEFTVASTKAVGTALFYYSLGIIPSGLWASILSIYYAKKKMKEQLFLYFLFFILCIFLTILLLKQLSYNAIPFAWSISYWITALVGGYYILKTANINITPLRRPIVTGIIAGVGMALFIFLFLFLRDMIPSFHAELMSIFGIGLSLIVYVLILKIIKSEELNILLKLMREI